MDEDQLLAVVGEIYEAATDPRRMRTIGERISRRMGSASSLVFTARRSTAALVELVSASDNFDSGAQAMYREYYSYRNEWFLRGAQRKPPFVARGGELIGYDQFDRTEFCNDWCKWVDIYHLLAATFPVDGDLIGAIGIHRPRSAEAFDDREKQFMERLAPHLMRAVQIANKIGTLQATTDFTQAILHELEVGLILLDPNRRPLFTNAVAERMVRSGRWFTVSGGRLRTVSRPFADSFARAVGSAYGAGGGGGLGTGATLRVPGRLAEPLAILVAPFRGLALDINGRNRVVAVIFSDPDASEKTSPQAVSDVFDLTPAESRLVAALCRGYSLVGYARERAISVNTAKAQLRSVFQKTGYTRQADLIAAALADPVLKLTSDRDAGDGDLTRRS